jgi:hypothetical protein
VFTSPLALIDPRTSVDGIPAVFVGALRRIFPTRLIPVRFRPLFRGLRRDKQPPKGDEDPHPCTDAQRAASRRELEDGTTDECTDEKRNNADNLVVPRLYKVTEVEKSWVRHELAPDGCEHDCSRGKCT